MINGNLTIAKLLNSSTPFDPATDLAPISLIATAPLVLSAPVTPTDPSGDFFQAARKAGNSWSYGSPGVGTVGHIGMELLKAKAGIDPVHVPYPGYPQVVTAMIGGQIQVALLPPGLALTQARAGKVKTIGVTSSVRSVLAPEVPSLSEAGIRDYQLEIWNKARCFFSETINMRCCSKCVHVFPAARFQPGRCTGFSQLQKWKFLKIVWYQPLQIPENW
jgi:tripartite-type tricarboxylate transporter receptor subunit TctC